MLGKTLGPYRIESELGSGGMGTVWLAEAVERCAVPSGTRVALKVVHPHLLSGPGFFKRFLREAEIGKAVTHPNVVRCYDADAIAVEGTQQNFLVMEYVEGQTLRDLLDELETVPEELCRHIGREVSKGLAAIHEAGVVHRDLKPENLLITPDHGVKIMDLGVARLADEAIRLSRSGAFVGSVLYASPEHFKGGGEDLDGRADLFSLGVILYELASGAHPHPGDDLASVLAKVVEEEPRRLGERNPQLSAFFEEVAHTLIAKDRGKRFGSAKDLLRVLEAGEDSTWWRGRAQTLRAETKQPLRRIRIPRETAVYGREAELAKLRSLYERAKAGDGQAILIEGEAGIGKTRLVDELIGRLRQDGEDLNFLYGSYPPGGAATAAGAWSTAYREQLGAEGLEETLEEYLAATPVLIPAFAALLRGEPPPEGREPLTKDSIQTVFVHATRALAKERPTIVLIDDLHFAPEEGRALFASVVLAVPEHRILLIGTLRPGVPEDWTAGITRLDHAEQRCLARLDPKDLSRLLRDAFRSDRLAEDLGLRIGEKSDGNPFFAFEIIRGLKEGHFLTQKPDGTWVTIQVIEDIRVPSSVLDLVQARVAGLEEAERELLDVASCCGFLFEPDLVADVVGERTIPVLRRLAHLQAKHHLVRSSGRHFVFDHHQVQEAIYGGLAEPLRERYHAAIGKALETREGAAGGDPKDLDGALCVDLCQHLLEGALGKRALRYLDEALDHLSKGYLNDQAIVLVERALEVPGLLESQGRMKVLLRKNGFLDLLGRREEQTVVLAEARALAKAADEKAALTEAERATAVLLWSTGCYEEAREHYGRCLAIDREIGDRMGEANATGKLGVVLHSLGRYGEAKDHHERHLAIAREIGDRGGEARATGNLGNVFYSLGRYGEARAQYEQWLAIAREIGDRRGEARATGNLGNVFYSLGRYEEAQAHYERHYAIAREIGDRRSEGVVTGYLGNILYSLGRYGEAKAHDERSLATFREIGDRQREAQVTGFLGGTFLVLGRHEEARAHSERHLAIAREIGDRLGEGHALSGLAFVAQEADERTQALHLASQALSLRREIGHGGGVAASLTQLGEIHWRTGNLDAARAALGEAADLLRQQSRQNELAYALALLGNLPNGDAEAAEAALQKAGEAGNTPQTRYYLWKATGKHVHLLEAKRLLDHIVDHAPEECRETMIENVRLHRNIMAAWEEHQDSTQ